MITEWIAVLQSGDARERENAAEQLGMMAQIDPDCISEAIPSLQQTLQDSDPDVRFRAFWSLGYLNLPRVRVLLNEVYAAEKSNPIDPNKNILDEYYRVKKRWQEWDAENASKVQNHIYVVGDAAIAMNGSQATLTKTGESEMTDKNNPQNEEKPAGSLSSHASGSGSISITSGRDTHFNSSPPLDQIAKLFETFHQQIDSKELPPQVKTDFKGELEEIRAEIEKGDKASESVLDRKFRHLWSYSKDAAGIVMSGIIGGPLGVISETVRRIDQRIRETAS